MHHCISYCILYTNVIELNKLNKRKWDNKIQKGHYLWRREGNRAHEKHPGSCDDIITALAGNVVKLNYCTLCFMTSMFPCLIKYYILKGKSAANFLDILLMVKSADKCFWWNHSNLILKRLIQVA